MRDIKIKLLSLKHLIRNMKIFFGVDQTEAETSLCAGQHVDYHKVM